MSATDPDQGYVDEIRDFLLGRLSQKARIVDLTGWPRQTELVPRALHWWIFEGQRYAPLPGALCDHWPLLLRLARRLLASYNPRWRILDRPEGEVDWLRTLSQGGNLPVREYICRGSQAGLDEAELRALQGWIRWIADAWASYCLQLRHDRYADEVAGLLRLLPPDAPQVVTRANIRRWAQVASRSRWPLLRDVVAESFRPAIEPQRLDRIPLPADRAQLFELYCLVRLLRCIEPEPASIRWLLSEHENVVQVPGVTAEFQSSIEVEQARNSEVYGSLLSEAIQRFGIGGLPRRSDLLLRFDQPRGGFEGLLVEVKSGDQDYKTTLYQLRVYQTVLQQQHPGRWLVWGLAERPAAGDISQTQLADIRLAASDESLATVWVFSNAASIPMVMQAAGLSTSVGRDH